MHELFANPTLTVALALFAGMAAHALAQHLRIPGIVVLLATGVLLGPDVAGIIRPDTLGDSLPALVGFAVAVILFDGALNLDVRKLRAEGRSIRQLSTVGALTTALGSTIAAHFILHWNPVLSILFGALVSVTGPTVINPLLRRLRVQNRVATVLSAEGIFVDAIGAIIAVVALEVLLGREATIAAGVWTVVLRLGGGFILGIVAGLLIAGALKVERLIPRGMENVATLAFIFAVFQFSNALIGESGIVAVVAAGLVAGNIRTTALTELREFKEEVTMMLIGLLFVLLAADVRLREIADLGWRGVLLVVVLMVVVRPLTVYVGTLGTDLARNEKAFLAWLAPRGIVAAAVSSFFANALDAAGIHGGDRFRAMVFLVIAVTVTFAGLTGSLAARLFGVRRTSQNGYVVLGANALGRAIANIMKNLGEDVVLIDSNPQACRAAEELGVRVIYGSGLSENVQQRAELDVRAGCIAVTANDEVNLLFVREVRRLFRVPSAWVSIRRGQRNVTPATVREHRVRVLFGQPFAVEQWISRLEKSLEAVEQWVCRKELSAAEGDESLYIAMIVRRGRKLIVVDEETAFRPDDVVYVALAPERRAEAAEQLFARGWAPVEAALVPEAATVGGENLVNA